MPRQIECDICDTPHLVPAVRLGVERPRVFDSSRRSKVDASEQFTHNDQVDAANRIAPKRRTIEQRLEDSYRPEVRIITEQLAQIQQSVLALFSRRKMVVFRVAHGAEKDGVRSQTEFSRWLRQRLAVTFDRDAPDIPFDEFKLVIVLAGHDFQDAASFTKDLRAYAITRQPRYECFHVW